MVFDEVDAGISGRVAKSSGAAASFGQQASEVLAVTHLAQVAAILRIRNWQ